MKKEEKTNLNLLKDFIDNSILDTSIKKELSYEIIPYGCNIEIRCYNTYTIDFIESFLNDLLIENQLNSIRGNIRITYNNFIKQ